MKPVALYRAHAARAPGVPAAAAAKLAMALCQEKKTFASAYQRRRFPHRAAQYSRSAESKDWGTICARACAHAGNHVHSSVQETFDSARSQKISCATLGLLGAAQRARRAGGAAGGGAGRGFLAVRRSRARLFPAHLSH